MSDHEPLKSVQLAEATVTLAPVEELQAESRRLEQEAESRTSAAAKLRADAIARFVEAGLILVGRPGEWAAAHPEAAAPLADAMATIRAIDAAAAAREAQHKPRLGGLLGQKKAPPETADERRLSEERGSQLRVMLAELGRSFGTALPAVTPVHGKAREMEVRAAASDAEANDLLTAARKFKSEADTRQAAIAQMGIDALLLAAQLQENGPGPVKSPLDLRPGERAFLVQPAELARQKTVASTGAGTQGLVFPASQTGIPYQVGSYRSQALKAEDVSRLGSGSFVVTNQRLGFVGNLKSFSFPLSGLRHAVQYTDGLLLMREGRENGDVLLTASAGLVLFYINYALQAAVG